jgi:hypothetical protein
MEEERFERCGFAQMRVEAFCIGSIGCEVKMYCRCSGVEVFL